MIIRSISCGFLKSLCYLVECEKTGEGVVIDPGCGGRTIPDLIRKSGITVRYIFNTHYHADHTGGNRSVRKATGAIIVIHRADLVRLMQPMNMIKLMSLQWARSPYPDMIIDCECEIKVGMLVFRVYHTPGHTPGGLCFHVGNCLFTGDTLFVGDSGATTFPGGNRPVLGKSLRRLMSLLPNDTVIYPGHDYGTTKTSTVGREKKENVNAREYGYYSED